MARIAGRTLAALVVAAALGAAGLLGTAFVPTLFGAESLIVTSGSMGRAMPVGSVAITRLVDAHAIAVGDVISFRTTAGVGTVTHRVIEVADEAGARVFRTKGDANPAPDPEPVRVGGRIHRVERVVPYAGTIVGYARSPIGGVALFLIPILGLLVERHRGRRARSSHASSPQVPVPSAEPPAIPAARPSPYAAALVGAVAGGFLARELVRRANRSEDRPRLAG